MTRLTVINVYKGSQAEVLGIDKGDEIISYNKCEVISKDDFESAFNRALEEGINMVELVIKKENKIISLLAEPKPLGVSLAKEAQSVDNSIIFEVDNQPDSKKVELVNIKIPLDSLVFIMVKIAIASIPALIILMLLGATAFTLFTTLIVSFR